MAYQSQAQLARNALGRASWKHRADLSHPEVLAARRPGSPPWRRSTSARWLTPRPC